MENDINYQELGNEVKQVVRLIKTGIVENDKKRKFNIYDYYLLIGSTLNKNGIKLSELYRKKYISISEFSTICAFLDNQAMCFGTRNVDRILGMYFQYGDRVITEEEKMYVYENLVNEMIPVNDIIFSLAMRKYANDTKDIDKTKKRVKKQK